MKYWIVEQDNGFSVRIDDVRGQERILLESCVDAGRALGHAPLESVGTSRR